MELEKFVAWLDTQDCQPCQGSIHPTPGPEFVDCPFTHLLMVARDPATNAELGFMVFCCGVAIPISQPECAGVYIFHEEELQK